MKIIYYDNKAEAEATQQRILESLMQDNQVPYGTVKYSDVHKDEKSERYYIFVLDKHLSYLTEEERKKLQEV